MSRSMMNSPPPSPSRATTPFGVSPRSGSPITLRPITPRPWPTLSYLQAPAGFGAPHRSGPSRTNYGYERMIGVAPFPSPLQKDRTRFDACLIRPSRSLTVKEIRDGALDGPNVDNYQKLLAKNQMSVQEHARQGMRCGMRWRPQARLGLRSRRRSGGVPESARGPGGPQDKCRRGGAECRSDRGCNCHNGSAAQEHKQRQDLPRSHAGPLRACRCSARPMPVLLKSQQCQLCKFVQLEKQK